MFLWLLGKEVEPSLKFYESSLSLYEILEVLRI